MMGKHQRDKGRRGERECVALCVRLGFHENGPSHPGPTCFRVDQYRGGEVTGADVHAIGHGLKLAIESKRGKRTNIKAALDQVCRDAPPGFLRVARCRDDNREAIVSMPEADFEELVRMAKQ